MADLRRGMFVLPSSGPLRGKRCQVLSRKPSKNGTSKTAKTVWWVELRAPNGETWSIRDAGDLEIMDEDGEAAA